MKLISMTDFVLEQTDPNYLESQEFAEVYYKIYKYAKFLKQPLELWMFVPCKLVDSFLVVLNLPIEPEQPYNDKKCDVWEQYLFYIKQYQQAKERCLFEGFDIHCASHNIGLNRNIEDLIKYNVQLTQTAIKQLGL